jgi:hypothetical protein
LRDDSLVERLWARVWGAPLVALAGGLVLALLYLGWMKYQPPNRERAKAVASCREAYAGAATSADSARVDFTIAIPLVAKSATRGVTCAEFRARGEL